jgi:Ca2+-binding RTX toxin-like protein
MRRGDLIAAMRNRRFRHGGDWHAGVPILTRHDASERVETTLGGVLHHWGFVGVTIDVASQLEGLPAFDGAGGNDTLELKASLVVSDNDALQNLETISAATFFTKGGVGLTIDVGGQLEGFEIIGSNYADTITGGAGADDIDAGLGDDIIAGFVGADVVDGGGGTDTLTLLATSLDLNGAANAALVNVERVSAASAVAGVVINLGLQSDGFEITGSGQGDTITGSTGADVIKAGGGDDTIVGFWADKVDGGRHQHGPACGDLGRPERCGERRPRQRPGRHGGGSGRRGRHDPAARARASPSSAAAWRHGHRRHRCR